MARKSVIGQINMFELYDTSIGDVEMVSLMPSIEEPEPVEEVKEIKEVEVIEELEVIEEVEVIEEPETVEEPENRSVLGDDAAVVMSRSYEKAGEKIEIAYMNYNKVRIIKGNESPEIKEFSSSKEAVDFYVQEMQALEEDE